MNMTWWIIKSALVLAAVVFILEYPAASPQSTDQRVEAGTRSGAIHNHDDATARRALVVAPGFDTRSPYPCLTCD